VFCLKMMALKKKRGGAKKIRFHPVDLTPFLSVLPFTLTSAQEKAIWEICQDFTAAPHAMNRLLQGDVGSGKTVVAAAAIYHTVKNGYAAAMMAPTEILALQHANTMEKLLSPHGIRIALLTGSTVKSKRKVLDEKMQNHEIDLLIGTHALIENTVWMNNLALVITDEQHRFGVKQRKALAMKAEEKNMLVMSATPI
ncbi:MAG TPA: DNA helicase RecG, partial [Clostridiales bacterium]|nr:DNA helicase RecG [Clostridiales bacterium]